MKYAALLTNNADDVAAWEAMPPDEAAAARAEEMPKWEALFGELGASGALGAGFELDSPATAKTVRVRGGETIVTDGPYAETKEQIGGLMEIEAEVGRMFSYRIVSMQKRGQVPNYESSMSKMWRSETQQRIAQTAEMTFLFGMREQLGDARIAAGRQQRQPVQRAGNRLAVDQQIHVAGQPADLHARMVERPQEADAIVAAERTDREFEGLERTEFGRDRH